VEDQVQGEEVVEDQQVVDHLVDQVVEDQVQEEGHLVVQVVEVPDLQEGDQLEVEHSLVLYLSYQF